MSVSVYKSTTCKCLGGEEVIRVESYEFMTQEKKHSVYHSDCDVRLFVISPTARTDMEGCFHSDILPSMF
jgi:hypothetical protein